MPTRRIALFVIALAAGLAWVASAAAMCNPNRLAQPVSASAGIRKTPTSGSGICFDGTLASIPTYQPFLDYNYLGASGALVELYDPSSSDFGAMGYQWDTQHENTFWMETGRDDTEDFFGASNPGVSHTYKVDWINYNFHFFLDGTIHLTYYDPYYNGCSILQGASLNQQRFQMIGGYYNPEYFTASQERHADNGQWYYTDPPNTFVQGNTNYYAASVESSSSFATWDKACASQGSPGWRDGGLL